MHAVKWLVLITALLAARVSVAETLSGTITDDTTCADAGHGTWVTSPDGSATIDLKGNWDSGTSKLYRMDSTGAGKVVPNSSATGATTTPYTVVMGAGAKYCIGLASSNHSASLVWEIQPLYVRDSQSHALQYRY